MHWTGARKTLIAAGFVFAATCGPMLYGQPGGGSAPSVSQRGYLSGTETPDEKIFIPPPPDPGSIAGKADLDIFRSTRSLNGTSRWRLATRDAAADPASMLDAFNCALGVKTKLSDVPSLSRLLQRALADAIPVIGPPKDRYARPRPFLKADGPVCTSLTPEFSRSGSYPSGHSTVGWLYALILAEVAPDHASAILARGRAFGESRVVCGVHYASDVEAGYVAAAGLVAVLHAKQAFRDDLEAARVELQRIRQNAATPEPERCASEKMALSVRPW